MKIILLLLGVLLLGGAAFGGYIMYQEYFPAQAAEEPKIEVPVGPPAYLKVKPLILPVIGPRGVEQFITLDVTVELVNQKSADDVAENMPRLVDAFLTTLYGEIDKRTVIDGQLVKVDAVKAKLKAAAVKLFGSDKVNDVLVQSLHQRRL